MADDGNRLLIGAPGAFYWQGQIYNIYLDKGNQAISTKEGGMLEDDSYRGYASAVGNFDASSEQEYVVGVPRAELLKGQITIYKQDLTIIRNITGEQVGAYFGYALAVQDLDGNNLDDIIVGAPLYSNYTSTESYDTGRVYVYYQNRQREFNPKRRYDILEGHDAKSRFGSALTGLGDINYDGYKDLAVGAPYGGKEGKGAVYIYHGSMKGILTQVSQVLHGADFPSVQSFGFSLSGGLDMDRNQYPDLLVGAYESMAAIQLWARPIVRVAASLQLQPQTIDLTATRLCHVSWTNQPVLCFDVRTCVKYKGLSVSERLLFDLSWEFDSLKKTNKRIFHTQSQMSEEFLYNKELIRNQTFCYSSSVYINADTVRDKLTPIQVKFNFDLAQDEIDEVLGGRKKRQTMNLDLEPVLDQYTPTTVQAEANILKDCGPDDICIPNLSVIPYELTKRVTVGKSDNIDIIVNIANRAEDAYEARLYIDMPVGIQLNRIWNQFNAPSCDWLGRENDTYNLILCDIGNPFSRNGKSNFTLTVYPNNIDGSVDNLEFSFKVNSTNPENRTYSDNQYTIRIPLLQSANLTMFGKTGGAIEQVIYNDTYVNKYKGTGLGPTVVHEYHLKNLGHSDIKHTLVHIYWPSFDDQGKNLLYLTTVPTISETEGVCTEEIYTPENSTLLIQGREDENRGTYRREKRSTIGQDTTKRITCTRQWCTKIVCKLQYMAAQQKAIIKITSRIWTKTLDERDLSKEPFFIVSQAVAQVKEMPYELPTTPETFHVIKREVLTYVNAERLAPRPDGIAPWIIGVAIAGGLLLLLILILLLWWCGFFRRKRPEEQASASASTKPLVYKNGNQPNYGNQQPYGFGNPPSYNNDLMSRPYE